MLKAASSLLRRGRIFHKIDANKPILLRNINFNSDGMTFLSGGHPVKSFTNPYVKELNTIRFSRGSRSLLFINDKNWFSLENTSISKAVESSYSSTAMHVIGQDVPFDVVVSKSYDAEKMDASAISEMYKNRVDEELLSLRQMTLNVIDQEQQKTEPFFDVFNDIMCSSTALFGCLSAMTSESTSFCFGLATIGSASLLGIMQLDSRPRLNKLIKRLCL